MKCSYRMSPGLRGGGRELREIQVIASVVDFFNCCADYANVRLLRICSFWG